MTRSAPALAPARQALRVAASAFRPLPALGPEAYARGHEDFEQRSDQRALLTAWLSRLLAPRACGATRVLSVGAGDGTVDAALARVLAAQGAAVAYDAVEPHAGSAARWVSRVAAQPGVTSAVHVSPFGAAALQEGYDVVLAIHSLYYVGDLRPALLRTAGLLGPGGRLVVLHAPRQPLNALAQELTAVPQPWSDEVVDALVLAGLDAETSRLTGRLDLQGASDDVLDFTVQCTLPPDLRPYVLDALEELRLPGEGLVVPHPLDAFVVRRPI